MSIVDSIQNARKRGISDEKILQEIIKQNPEKEPNIKEALKREATPAQILNEIIKRNSQPAQTKTASLEKEIPEEFSLEQKRIAEAKKRIEALRKEKGIANSPAAEIKIAGKNPQQLMKDDERERKFLTERLKEESVEKSLKEKREVIPTETREDIGLINKFKNVFKKPSTISPKGHLPQSPAPAPTNISPPITETGIVRPLPTRPTIREKLWVRIFAFSLIVVILGSIGTFWYWYFNRDKIQPSPAPRAETSTPAPSARPSPEPSVAPSLITVDSTRLLTIADLTELRTQLSQVVQEVMDDGQYKRVVIKDASENRVITLKEFFDGLLVRAPEELYQKVEPNFTLFVYAQRTGNRLGLISRVTRYEGLESLLRSKEFTMENDFEPYFTLMGKSGAAVTAFFRDASTSRGYIGPNFRYQTLTRTDLGIVYLVSGNYFVFTSSWENMKSVIDKLGIVAQSVELTQNLKYGNKGDQVKLLQSWLKQDPVVYPEGKITGNFLTATRKAVIRFQEKYQADVLTPQGLLKGTGIVDEFTRIKLNELYSASGVIPPFTELTTDLRYGNNGNEVKVLQTCLAKDRIIYPEGKITGWFGPLTRAAVKRLQEKYALEILTPQGIATPTGIVDKYTRDKINALCK